MKIVYFTDAYWPRANGVTVSIQTFADELRRRGHEIRIVCPEYPEMQGKLASPLDKDLIRVPSISAVVSKEDRFANPLQLRECLPQLDAFKPDVVHVQTEFSFGEMGRYYCRMRGYPILSTCHTHWEQYFEHYLQNVPSRMAQGIARKIMRFSMRRDHIILVPSSQIAAVLQSYGLQKKIIVLPTGIDADLFQPDPDRDRRVHGALIERFPRLARGPILLYVGRIGQEKNIIFLFEILRMVLKHHPEATLLLVGDGPYRAALAKFAVRSGLADNVLFTGYLPREDLASVYRMAKVFVFASKTETQGLVTIESMLCGTPVVAIGEMGTADMMAGDNGGFMVKEDLTEFSGRVLELLDSPSLHAAKSAEAILYAQRWTVGGLTDKLLEIYEKTAALRKPAKRRIFSRRLRPPASRRG